MRFWFDTEFYEDGRTIELISIGVVCEDGSEFYAEVEGVEITDPWLIENVKPYLTGQTMSKDQIGPALLQFVLDRTDKPEFWAYYSAYDWVALCQLYGKMNDLPKEFPMFCRDLKQELVLYGNPVIPIENSQDHNSLADAKWTRDAHIWFENNVCYD